MRNLLKHKEGNAAIVGGLVGILVVIIIGIFVYGEIAGSINVPDAGVTPAANVNTTAGTVFGLAPIVAIVIIASMILGIVANFGKSRSV